MRSLAIACVSVCLVAAVAAQAEFEVSSVKPAAPQRDIREIVRRAPPGQWKLLSVTLHNAIIVAYPEFRLPGLLAGVPNWAKETRFDFQGRMNPAATQREVQAMVRRLLADRFALRTHTEQRPLDVYLLTLKTPGKPGPGLTPAAASCVKWKMTGGRLPDECDLARRPGAAGGMVLPVGTVADLIDAMSLWAVLPSSAATRGAIDRPVVDRTGLEGYFQYIGPSAAYPASNPEAAGAFFTLLEEQLGLKLTKAREMVDVLVIDSVSMPEPD